MSRQFTRKVASRIHPEDYKVLQRYCATRGYGFTIAKLLREKLREVVQQWLEREEEQRVEREEEQRAREKSIIAMQKEVDDAMGESGNGVVDEVVDWLEV